MANTTFTINWLNQFNDSGDLSDDLADPSDEGLDNGYPTDFNNPYCHFWGTEVGQATTDANGRFGQVAVPLGLNSLDVLYGQSELCITSTTTQPDGTGGQTSQANSVPIMIVPGIGQGEHDAANESSVGTGGSATPTGSYACFPGYNDCRIHWRYANTLYHFTPNLKTNYPQFQDPSRWAVAQWTTASDPDSPWHTHEVEAAASHVDVMDIFDPNALMDALPDWDGDANGPPGRENPHFSSMQIRIDKPRADAGAFYTGTGTPPPDKTDAWSVLAEEWGHVQNMAHFVPPGHEDPDGDGPNPGHLFDHTMSGQTGQAQTYKRALDATERLAACIPYRQIHDRC